MGVTLSGVTLLFNEPPEARKPDVRWRLYVFKGGEVLNGKSYGAYICKFPSALSLFLLPFLIIPFLGWAGFQFIHFRVIKV